MLRRQESARKPLRGVVNTAAPYQLAQTVRLCLNILQNTVMNVFILLKRFLKMVERDLHCCARKLHTTVGRHISWTYKVHASDEALAACNRNLR
jgi:hypothetical protein